MLKEINIHEMIAVDDPILVIMGDRVYTAEEFFDDEIRILIDEGAAAAEPEEEEVEEEPEPEPEKPKRRRGRRSHRELVEEAYERGYDTAEDIVRLTGLNADTVRKCIREMEAESYE